MSDKSSTLARRTSTKRKSVLAELGIKPAGDDHLPTNKPKAAVITPATIAPHTARRTSIQSNNKPASPTVSKNSSTNPNYNGKKKIIVGTTSPSSVKNPPLSSSPLQSPTTSSSPRLSSNLKRRSMLVSNSNNHSVAPVSPLVRRASINHTISSTVSKDSNNNHKRLSLSAVLEPLNEIQKEELQRLKENEVFLKAQHETRVTMLEAELEKLKEELKNKSLAVDNNEISTELFKKQIENELFESHQIELKNQERKFKALRIELDSDYEQKIQNMKLEHERQQEQLKKDHEMALLTQKKEQKLSYEQDQSTLSKLQKQIDVLEESQTNSHVRKLQNELSTTIAALEELKHQFHQQIETIERRHREEIRQLQTGNDDTAQAWLEKTKSTQQELDQLHDKLYNKEEQYRHAINELKITHEKELIRLNEVCETKESQLEEQSRQIENLFYQVETLQNSLEAATVRLEQHTSTKRSSSSQTVSSNRDDTENDHERLDLSNNLNNDHQVCQNRLEAKQKEIDDLRVHLAEIKETHEAQINRLGQDKVNALQELQKKIGKLEQKLAINTTPPHSPTRPLNINRHQESTNHLHENEEEQKRLIKIAEQHRKEIKMMHDQYQIIVNTKNRELEDYAYRIKALVAAKQKEMEKLQIETNHTIDRYEKDIEGYENKLIEYEKESNKLKDRVTHWEIISKNNEILVQDIKKGCMAHLNENAHLIRLVHQLQSEIHGHSS
ncbi:uncharacterized protein BX663DRAFT_495711 [Cokeromyces recurvatus]|uniref:uncharacterized protein n=1 Tax=Cokeromyces recurvatus TaxID=90255 RepID=UPI00221F0E8B|nr:uncharacterized protein BX663DRAFT_495711 [Cokeromyces recurvatus]KAI7907377.1 hypothetical protein BX663DRAFT_495711 [Cokeromyces recurvatus]